MGGKLCERKSFWRGPVEKAPSKGKKKKRLLFGNPAYQKRERKPLLKKDFTPKMLERPQKKGEGLRKTGKVPSKGGNR